MLVIICGISNHKNAATISRAVRKVDISDNALSTCMFFILLYILNSKSLSIGLSIYASAKPISKGLSTERT